MVLGILFLFPILPNAIQSISIILFTVLSITFYRKSWENNWLSYKWKPLFISCGWFLLLCLTIIYSIDKGKGGDYIVRGLSLVLFPFIFIYFIPRISENRKRILLGCYIFTHIFLLFFMYFKIVEGIDSIGYINENGERIKGFNQEGFIAQIGHICAMPFSLSRYYLNENEITSLFVHKAYLSMGYTWSIFMMIYALIKKNVPKYLALLLVLLCLIFTLVVIYFTSVPNLVSLFFLAPIFIFILLKNRKQRKLFSIITTLSFVLLSQTSFVQKRVLNDVRLVNGYEESKQLIASIFSETDSSGSNIRLEVWKCAYKTISKRFFSGYGVGSEPSVLKQCYNQIGCVACSEYNFNAHNQYATMFLNGGVVMLLAFIFSMLYYLRLAYLHKNWLYLFFLLLFLINLVSESMLIRIHGILFFAIFNSIFFSELYKEIQSKKKIGLSNV